VSEVQVQNVLTRTTGFLKTVTSHSLQPYRGCSFGNALCGVGCYVQHSYWVTKGRDWGSFLEVRTNAADAYRVKVDSERRWPRKTTGSFGVFMSSSTDPFVPQETKYGVSQSVLEAMVESSPDVLVVQTHSHTVERYLPVLKELDGRCELRVHVSIETDLESVPELPRHASSVRDRFRAVALLRDAGIRVVVTVAPLLPIEDPERFFSRISDSVSTVVIDHFVEGDGSKDGNRTLRTPLPDAMRGLDPDSLGLAYRDQIVAVAERCMPGRVGVSIDGFAGRMRDQTGDK